MRYIKCERSSYLLVLFTHARQPFTPLGIPFSPAALFTWWPEKYMLAACNEAFLQQSYDWDGEHTSSDTFERRIIPFCEFRTEIHQNFLPRFGSARSGFFIPWTKQSQNSNQDYIHRLKILKFRNIRGMWNSRSSILSIIIWNSHHVEWQSLYSFSNSFLITIEFYKCIWDRRGLKSWDLEDLECKQPKAKILKSKSHPPRACACKTIASPPHLSLRKIVHRKIRLCLCLPHRVACLLIAACVKAIYVIIVSL